MKPAELKALFDRKARAMARRPAFAHGTGQARIRLGDGLACDVEHPERTLVVDQPSADGGAGAGHPPDELMRASIGASLAMGYRLWGARLGVAIDSVEVEMTCAYDARGQLGVADEVPPGWQSVRFDVTIASDAPEDAIRRVVDTADRHSPMLANLALSVRRVHHLSIVRAKNPLDDRRHGTNRSVAGHATGVVAPTTPTRK